MLIWSYPRNAPATEIRFDVKKGVTMEEKKNFILWDYYENYGLVGKYDTEAEAREAAKQWNDDTDGECQIVMFRLANDKKGYEVVA